MRPSDTSSLAKLVHPNRNSRPGGEEREVGAKKDHRTVLLLALLTVMSAVVTLWRLEPPTVTAPLNRLDRTLLSVEGVQLGWSLEQVVALHGPPDEVSQTHSWTDPELKVLFDELGQATFVSGAHLEYDGKPYWKNGTRERYWLKYLEAVEPDEFVWPGCGQATTFYTYSYQRQLGLTIVAIGDGHFWKSEPRASRFTLSRRVPHVFLGSADPWESLIEPLPSQTPSVPE